VLDVRALGLGKQVRKALVIKTDFSQERDPGKGFQFVGGIDQFQSFENLVPFLLSRCTKKLRVSLTSFTKLSC